jgi:hypothetical protein
MLMKIASHVVVFAIGAGGGIWWGVHNPAQAQQISDSEQQTAMRVKAAVAQGKQQALQQVVNDQNSTPGASVNTDHVKQMLQGAQQEFNDAKSKIGN